MHLHGFFEQICSHIIKFFIVSNLLFSYDIEFEITIKMSILRTSGDGLIAETAVK